MEAKSKIVVARNSCWGHGGRCWSGDTQFQLAEISSKDSLQCDHYNSNALCTSN